MQMVNYQQTAFGYAKYTTEDYPFAALSEEVGEVMGKLAKFGRKHGVSIDTAIALAAEPTEDIHYELREQLRKELGDVMWQLNACCTQLGFATEDVAQDNLDKLSGRASRGTIIGEGDER